MPITLTSLDLGTLCSGHSWEVADEELLAQHIASVALGQARHVARVLAQADLPAAQTAVSSSSSAADGAVALLTATNDDPSHRDGWMFQVMSWIAAHQATASGLIRAPQMHHAHKGFDGLQLRIDQQSQQVTAAVIFEDKATSRPRDSIRDEVWPEFSTIEQGARDNLVTAAVVGLLQTRPNLDPDHAIKNVVWSAVREYRLSVTIGPTHRSEQRRRALFRGYDTIAEGPVSRRHGQVFEVANLRPWMAELAAKAIDSIHRATSCNV